MPGRLKHLIGLAQTSDRISSAPETGRGGNHRLGHRPKTRTLTARRERWVREGWRPQEQEEELGQAGGGTDHGQGDQD